MKEIAHIFTQLGYQKDESKIRLTLYQLGNAPASVIAKKLKKERTWVYKTLRKIARDGLVQQTKKKGVSYFWIKDASSLFSALERQEQQIKTLQWEQEFIQQRLLQYETKRYPHLPKIALYDGVDGIQSLYNDIYETVITNKYLVIKFFASNTFESQTSVNMTLKNYYQNIFQKLKKKKVTIDTYLGNGILIMEQITKTTNIENLSDLPAGNSAVNIFIVGKVIYLIIFKDIPFGIKIDSEDVANTLHFLFEKLEVE